MSDAARQVLYRELRSLHILHSASVLVGNIAMGLLLLGLPLAVVCLPISWFFAQSMESFLSLICTGPFVLGVVLIAAVPLSEYLKERYSRRLRESPRLFWFVAGTGDFPRRRRPGDEPSSPGEGGATS